MLRLLNSADIDLGISGIQKIAAACLLVALFPVQGYCASSVSRSPASAAAAGLQQTESASSAGSRQNATDRQKTGLVNRNSDSAAKMKQNMRDQAGAARQDAGLSSSAKSKAMLDQAQSKNAGPNSAVGKMNPKLPTNQMQQLQNDPMRTSLGGTRSR